MATRIRPIDARTGWLVRIAVAVTLLMPGAAGAFSGAVALGGGARVSPGTKGLLCVDFSLGVRLPLRYWHSPVFFFPRVGLTLDGAAHPDLRLHVGPGVGFNVVIDELEISLEPTFVTDFNHLGIGAQLQIGIGAGILPLTLSYDALLPGGKKRVHTVRALIGVDLASLFVFFMRMSSGG